MTLVISHAGPSFTAVGFLTLAADLGVPALALAWVLGQKKAKVEELAKWNSLTGFWLTIDIWEKV